MWPPHAAPGGLIGCAAGLPDPRRPTRIGWGVRPREVQAPGPDRVSLSDAPDQHDRCDPSRIAGALRRSATLAGCATVLPPTHRRRVVHHGRRCKKHSRWLCVAGSDRETRHPRMPPVSVRADAVTRGRRTKSRREYPGSPGGSLHEVFGGCYRVASHRTRACRALQ